MPASNRPKAITREDIAEIYETLDDMYMEKAKGEFVPGQSVDSLVHQAVDFSEKADSYREIAKLEDDRNLLEHKHYTKEAWKQNRHRKIQKTVEEHNAMKAHPSNTTILKVVK